ncbi:MULTISPECIES: UDP-N-acetylglucosamine 1-carboxyvinyltransferase [unclassified Candidatus Frackibacter]|uniref:UDP-N-acetylglucosamine 1-carboxyvinyltransferase n=1 Tax=unclassified Candidatus Frackibacter TaxID=2648818 RepID=UPI000892017A|nr:MULTISPECIES: UDP-N-acetylglucosamine 1-carboxyvinyltransferase [unclassified Candidatus Frackibacter]SDC10209.1 UDP-N-acetylglucosamine 1-carboxyvinyltransferase [Candidatus Frackibacter sp. WG11]SEM37302.1 UDP-N-acetylglucosamine 1-carboxyvinyltransferase [Candidatus Frackibacter sp. WG12]SFL42745.1 UDP-N-acetylglucosamine 1-carboxyvinyltransferase [Candidatus Frackibacter sp. WG13]
MKKLVVQGTERLQGKINVSGAKNAALPIIAASLLAKGDSVLKGIPDLRDVNNLVDILNDLGAEASFANNMIQVQADSVNKYQTDDDLARKLRASYYTLGALLGRYGEACTVLPGGCEIGNRPIDLHLKGFSALGADVELDHGLVKLKADRLTGAKIYLDYPSVGATMNIMLAAVLAEGQTVIENVAREPEIIDLANYLNVMGAKVKGAGTDIIKIEGVKELIGTDYTIIPDRIEVGTYMMATAAISGEVIIENVLVEHVRSLISKLKEMGIEIIEDVNRVKVKADKGLSGVDIKTMPYPGFPTDMQSQFMVLLTQASGENVVIETVFENRFGHVDELRRMGAQIKVDGRSAVVAKASLEGTQVEATDLRAGAALIIAGLAAEGETEIYNVYHIERGYEDVTEKLRGIGAKIELKS